MSSKLPINNNNAQTIAEFLNLHKSQLSEEGFDESYKFAFDDEAFCLAKKPLGFVLN